MFKAPVRLSTRQTPHGRAVHAKATPDRLTEFTRHALSVLSATTGRKKSAEGRVQLEEKARMDILMSSRLEEHRALSKAHEGQASCRRAKAGKCVRAALSKGALVV